MEENKLERIIFGLKAENERLQDENKRLKAFKDEAISSSLYGVGLKDGKQLAVNETIQHYKAEIEGLELELSQSLKIIKTIKKDTAQEILQDLFYFIDNNSFWLEETGDQVDLIKAEDALQYMRKKANEYGVEVDE